MIPHGVEVFVSLDTIDLRWSFDRLGALVADRLGREVRGGALFVFFGRRRDAVKILFADDTGLCLFYKRLDRRTFRMPEATREGELVVEIEERALDDLLDGIDVEPAAKKSRAPRLH
jgi:transposase